MGAVPSREAHADVLTELQDYCPPSNARRRRRCILLPLTKLFMDRVPTADGADSPSPPPSVKAPRKAWQGKELAAAREHSPPPAALPLMRQLYAAYCEPQTQFYFHTDGGDTAHRMPETLRYGSVEEFYAATVECYERQLVADNKTVQHEHGRYVQAAYQRARRAGSAGKRQAGANFPSRGKGLEERQSSAPRPAPYALVPLPCALCFHYPTNRLATEEEPYNPAVFSSRRSSRSSDSSSGGSSTDTSDESEVALSPQRRARGPGRGGYAAPSDSVVFGTYSAVSVIGFVGLVPTAQRQLPRPKGGQSLLGGAPFTRSVPEASADDAASRWGDSSGMPAYELAVFVSKAGGSQCLSRALLLAARMYAEQCRALGLAAPLPIPSVRYHCLLTDLVFLSFMREVRLRCEAAVKQYVQQRDILERARTVRRASPSIDDDVVNSDMEVVMDPSARHATDSEDEDEDEDDTRIGDRRTMQMYDALLSLRTARCTEAELTGWLSSVRAGQLCLLLENVALEQSVAPVAAPVKHYFLGIVSWTTTVAPQPSSSSATSKKLVAAGAQEAKDKRSPSPSRHGALTLPSKGGAALLRLIAEQTDAARVGGNALLGGSRAGSGRGSDEVGLTASSVATTRTPVMTRPSTASASAVHVHLDEEGAQPRTEQTRGGTPFALREPRRARSRSCDGDEPSTANAAVPSVSVYAVVGVGGYPKASTAQSHVSPYIAASSTVPASGVGRDQQRAVDAADAHLWWPEGTVLKQTVDTQTGSFLQRHWEEAMEPLEYLSLGMFTAPLLLDEPSADGDDAQFDDEEEESDGSGEADTSADPMDDSCSPLLLSPPRPTLIGSKSVMCGTAFGRGVMARVTPPRPVAVSDVLLPWVKHYYLWARAAAPGDRHWAKEAYSMRHFRPPRDLRASCSSATLTSAALAHRSPPRRHEVEGDGGRSAADRHKEVFLWEFEHAGRTYCIALTPNFTREQQLASSSGTTTTTTSATITAISPAATLSKGFVDVPGSVEEPHASPPSMLLPADDGKESLPQPPATSMSGDADDYDAWAAAFAADQLHDPLPDSPHRVADATSGPAPSARSAGDDPQTPKERMAWRRRYESGRAWGGIGRARQQRMMLDASFPGGDASGSGSLSLGASSSLVNAVTVFPSQLPLTVGTGALAASASSARMRRTRSETPVPAVSHSGPSNSGDKASPPLVLPPLDSSLLFSTTLPDSSALNAQPVRAAAALPQPHSPRPSARQPLTSSSSAAAPMTMSGTASDTAYSFESLPTGSNSRRAPRGSESVQYSNPFFGATAGLPGGEALDRDAVAARLGQSPYSLPDMYAEQTGGGAASWAANSGDLGSANWSVLNRGAPTVGALTDNTGAASSTGRRDASGCSPTSTLGGTHGQTLAMMLMASTARGNGGGGRPNGVDAASALPPPYPSLAPAASEGDKRYAEPALTPQESSTLDYTPAMSCQSPEFLGAVGSAGGHGSPRALTGSQPAQVLLVYEPGEVAPPRYTCTSWTSESTTSPAGIASLPPVSPTQPLRRLSEPGPSGRYGGSLEGLHAHQMEGSVPPHSQPRAAPETAATGDASGARAGRPSPSTGSAKKYVRDADGSQYYHWSWSGQAGQGRK